MLDSDEAVYVETAEIKRGLVSPAEPFASFIQEMRTLFPDAAILNARYETATAGGETPPLLNVIIEYDAAQAQFIDSNGIFDKEKQSLSLAAFARAISATGHSEFDLTDLFVVFSPFERLARTAANEKVKAEEIERLALQIQNKGVWKIKTFFDGVDFLFWTDEQMNNASAQLKQDFKDAYDELVRPHDEFGYLVARSLHYNFNSKETFERDYHANWSYYYR